VDKVVENAREYDSALFPTEDSKVAKIAAIWGKCLPRGSEGRRLDELQVKEKLFNILHPDELVSD
jgi:hypothetical protein